METSKEGFRASLIMAARNAETAGERISSSRRRVLVYMPEAQAAAKMRELLVQEGAEAITCADVVELGRAAAVGADAAVIHEALFSEEVICSLAEGLRGQPAWAEIPIFLVASKPPGSEVAVKATAWGNVWVLEKPVHRAAVRSALQVAARVRAKELQIRELLAEIERDQQALRDLNLKLEDRVAERTRELTRTIGRLEAEAQERSKAQGDLRTTNEELQNLTAQLRSLGLELTRAEDRERRRIAQLLHDHLQQLLVAARLELDVMRQKIDQPALRAKCHKMDDNLEEAVNTTRLLAVQLAPPVLQEKGLAAALAWMAQCMRSHHRLRVKLNVMAEAEAQDQSIAGLLFQCVRETLLNVVKHAGVRTATVTLSRLAPGLIQVQVADKGVGFDPARRKEAGASGGFGLQSIKQRLEVLGGQMTVDSAPGRGTCVTLSVPVAAGARPAGAVQGRPTEVGGAGVAGRRPAPAGARAGGKVRVMLADDHQIVRRGLVELLEGRPDVEVVGEATDGQMAVELSKQLRPEVIIMDINMPGMNGIEATRLILEDQPNTQIISFSMHEAPFLADAMRRAGAVAVVRKKGPVEDLVSALSRCLQKARPEDSTMSSSARLSGP